MAATSPEKIKALTLSEIRLAAAKVGCCPRSIQKALDGKPVRGMAGDRVAEAIRILFGADGPR